MKTQTLYFSEGQASIPCLPFFPEIKQENIFIMKLDSPSQLGPWIRYQETHGQHDLYQKTNNSTFKDQLILPRVSQFRPQIQKPKESKQKSFKPIRVRPIQLAIKPYGELQNVQDQHGNARKSHTLSFDPPKFSFYGRKLSRPFNTKDQTYRDPLLHTQRDKESPIVQQIKKREVSKVDLKADYLQSEDKIEPRSPSNPKEREFSKKRSLMELLKFLKMNPNQKSLQEREINGKNDKFSQLGRYEGYRNLVNISAQAESRYMPYFEARRSLNSTKKR